MPTDKLTIDAKIKNCDPEIKNFITAMKAENKKLQSQIAKHQAKHVSENNKIEILEKEIKNHNKSSKLSKEAKKLLDRLAMS